MGGGQLRGRCARARGRKDTFLKGHATSEMRKLAGRLIAHQARHSAACPLPAALQVCERLRSHLVALMGTLGFRALLSRALALAAAEIPSLGTRQIEADGSFKDWEEQQEATDKDHAAEGGALLVAQLLGLLAAFIGEDLTLRQVREIWPEMAIPESTSRKGSSNA